MPPKQKKKEPTQEEKNAAVIAALPKPDPNDLGIFQESLMGALEDLSEVHPRRVIGDCIYSGEPYYVSTKNDFDPLEIMRFKNRALSRHEKYNGLLKNFDVLSKPFRRHSDLVNEHRKHFHAVIVLVQVQLENGGFKLWETYP